MDTVVLQLMQAITMAGPGSPDVLRPTELPQPQIETSTQLRIQLKAAGVNPVDTKIRARGLFFPDALPAVIGCDGAGIVVEVGEAERQYRVGDEVYFCHGGLGREPGNYAQYTVIESAHVARKPANINFIEAAAAPLVLITAWEALFNRAQLQPAQTVLIHAGAGGVGHVAIQLAKQVGARVITTVSDPIKADFVKSLGADVVVMYRETDFVQAVRQLTGGRGADVVLDTIGGEVFRQSINATANYGDLITLLDPGNDVVWKEARTRNLRIGYVLMLTPLLRDLPHARAHQITILQKCATLMERGQLKIHVSKVFELSQAAKAHALLEEGHVMGKLVLKILE